MNIKTEQEIISDVLAGDTNAYHILVSRYRNMIFTLVNNIILNREDAEEIAQDVFIKAYTGLRTFKGSALFSTWLYRIAVNAALNKKKIKVFNVIPIGESFENETDDNIQPLLDQYEIKERKKFVQLAMLQLKDDERICITMYYLNELQVSEIHDLTGISTANIKVLLYRGRKNLYRQLEQLLKTEMNNLI
ncbi:sigma-70 family RNA polymerase sigma factor [Panacibacter ginsenosidivorans]|uniref:RNA polymerase sigma factor n=1 Tax=Panacibacter ginsenosidivorans TaxID=1813871 RepID=A0A5B8V5X1_9BACT|nr:sigma-70 family RNA polymerase sigma factor [Panacibacter ginsenosidivorans]QEC66609.1 sigma-70 family RNA polymerase sigma factor [Panacibacter ginsenosidivorans]